MYQVISKKGKEENVESRSIYITCTEGCKGKYCFLCIAGPCPFGRDFMTECYPRLILEQKLLFDELFRLRAEIAKRCSTSQHYKYLLRKI